jgi:hypothetical protein
MKKPAIEPPIAAHTMIAMAIHFTTPLSVVLVLATCEAAAPASPRLGAEQPDNRHAEHGGEHHDRQPVRHRDASPPGAVANRGFSRRNTPATSHGKNPRVDAGVSVTLRARLRPARPPQSGDVIHLEHQGRRQMILPAYPLSAGIDSMLVTMHVPRCVSIGSPGWGGAGSSTFSTSSKLAAWMVMM